MRVAVGLLPLQRIPASPPILVPWLCRGKFRSMVVVTVQGAPDKDLSVCLPLHTSSHQENPELLL